MERCRRLFALALVPACLLAVALAGPGSAADQKAKPCTAVFLKWNASKTLKVWAVGIRARQTNCSKARSIAKRRGVDEAGGPKGVVPAWECEWNLCRQGQREVRWTLAFLDPDFRPKNEF